jgi:transposase
MALHVAIDVHDRTLFALGVDPHTGEECFRRRFPHTSRGTDELLARLSPGDTVVLEATRGAQHLANRLDASGATVLLADPQRCRLLGFRGKKTDYRDDLALLSHLRSGELATVWRPDPRTREMRQLTAERHAYNHTLIQLKNRIIALLREEGLTPPGAALWEPEGDAWLATQPLPPAAGRILRRAWNRLQATRALKETQEAAFAELALRDPRAWRLLQILGFGPTAAVIVLGEVGDFSRFADGKHLASYAGLDPQVEQSGDRCRTGRISKSGRSQLRWIMVEVAWGHVLADGPEAGLYHRLVAKGKPKGVAITALARHLLVLAHTLLTREEAYRKLDGWGSLRKLANLAGARRPDERGRQGKSDIDWGRARYREITGQEPPRRPAAPEKAERAEPAPSTALERERETTAPAPAAEKKAGSTSGAGADGRHAPQPARAAARSGAATGARRSPAQRAQSADTA